MAATDARWSSRSMHLENSSSSPLCNFAISRDPRDVLNIKLVELRGAHWSMNLIAVADVVLRQSLHASPSISINVGHTLPDLDYPGRCLPCQHLLLLQNSTCMPFPADVITHHCIACSSSFFFFSFDCEIMSGHRVAIYVNAMIYCPQVKIFDALLRLNSYLTRCLISSTLLVNHIRLSNSREDLAGRNSFARL